MIRILLISLLLGAGPLAAQHSADDVPPLRSGTRVRVFLQDGPSAGATGVLVGGTRDTLRLASPSLGLVRLSAADLQRLETPAASGPAWKYVAIDPRLGIPEVRQNPERPGIPVRISARGRPRTTQRMHDFSADSLYLFAEGRPTAVSRADLHSLQVPVGQDRWRGAMTGAPIGALAGALVALNAALTDDGDGGYLGPQIEMAFGGVLGCLVGAAAGWVLAPSKWEYVTVNEPRR